MPHERRSRGVLLLSAVTFITLVLASACARSAGDAAADSTTTPTPSARPSAAATEDGTRPTKTARPKASKTPRRTPTATKTPTRTPTLPPSPACEQGAANRKARYSRAADEIRQAMAGYEGTWSLAVIDLDCEVALEINPDYVQYTASSGKIVVVIAALRQVRAGKLTLGEIEEHLNQIMHHSLDSSADAINEMVTPAQVQEVLQLSGVSSATRFEHHWRYGFMTATDLARVWEALLRGKLLNRKWTEYLLQLAAEVDLPPEYATFPGRFDRPGYQYGQKAGYYVSDGVPYFLLGAGYLRPKDGSSLGFAMVLMMRTTNPELLDPQRRSVFPVIIKYILDG